MKKAILLFSLGIMHLTHSELPPHFAEKQVNVEQEFQNHINEYNQFLAQKVEILGEHPDFMSFIEAACKKASEDTKKLAQQYATKKDRASCIEYRKSVNTYLELKTELMILKFGMDPRALMAAGLAAQLIASQSEK